ncbi:hypothetical protein G4G28_18980 [Massilia sp. Dwa41.01b]|uniref:hypothetical protein n=1 Tax=unclassified Massilia TaxID=2609279 RepID=UPI00160146F1|nr:MULTISPECIES: hypothetical protein [unclassified Massilia]QNA90055.1 hypothetical protein G4G28_18980 [Massilia sp. Dwa41.01b]QNB00944.1 hypothetical protein G4G31_22575 [Massilia sp. Se16.2.3]
MMRKPASVAAIFALSLSCFHGWDPAHAAAANPLERIDPKLIAEHFKHERVEGVGSEIDDSRTLPGCPWVRSFVVMDEGASGDIVVALCSSGTLGPASVEATVGKQVAEARRAVAAMPAPLVAAVQSGTEGVEVPLAGGRRGKALTIPAIGHGLVMAPFAYAVTAKKDMTLVVQPMLNPNRFDNLNAPLAALLQAIDARLQDRARPEANTEHATMK